MIPLLTETGNLYGFQIRLWRAVFKIQPTELLCAVLQIGRSLVRSQLVSLEFFIDIKSY